MFASEGTPAALSSGGDAVPELLALPDPPSVPPRRIGLLLGLPGLWLLPRTTGPHLAAGSLSKAMQAYLLALIGGACGLVLVAAWLFPAGYFPDGSGLAERARLLVARRVSQAATTGRLSELLVIPGVVIGSLIGVGLLTLALVPWLAAGDTAKSVYRRSLRLGLWLTTLAIPAQFVFAVTVRAARWAGLSGDDLAETTAAGAAVAYVLWAGLRSGLRYAGPAEGPGFGPVEPRCEECGYRLAGLSPEGRCPECAVPVRWSLRRYEPPEPAGRSAADRIRGYFRLIARLIRRPARVFMTVRPRHDFANARGFWLASWLGLAAVVTTISALDVLLAGDAELEPVLLTGLATVLGLMAAQAFMGIVCTLGAVLRAECPDLRISAIALSYGSAMLWPAALWLLATETLMSHVQRPLYRLGEVVIPVVDQAVSISGIAQTVGFVVLVVLLGLWAYCVDAGYRSLRHTIG